VGASPGERRADDHHRHCLDRATSPASATSGTDHRNPITILDRVSRPLGGSLPTCYAPSGLLTERRDHPTPKRLMTAHLLNGGATVTPPNDRAAEQAVLGAALLTPSVLDALADTLTPGDFYHPAHGQIFAAMRELHRAGAPADPVTLAAHLAEAGTLAKIGGAPYLHTLMQAVPTSANAGFYARIVADHARRRSVIGLGLELTQLATSGADTTHVIAKGRTILADTPDVAWPSPIPLTARRTAPVFPVDALPEWVAAMVHTVASFTQTPIDLAACISLAALSTAAGGKVSFEVRDGWAEPANLFTVAVLPPGIGGVLRLIPLLLGWEPSSSAPSLIVEARIAAKVARQSAERAADKAAGSSDPAQHVALLAEATAAELDAEAITIPAEPQLIADDVTPEETASLLAAQGGRIAVLSAEGGIFATLAGRYSGAPNLEVFLKGHAGDMLRVNRKSRDREFIDHPALTLGLAVQPEVLRDLAGMPGMRGKGLLARILFAVPENTVGRRTPGAAALHRPTAATYATNLAALALSLADLDQPRTIPLSPEADKRILALEWDVEPQLAPGGALEHIVDWGSKYVGAIVRIAGLLHLAEHLRDGWGQPIDADTIDRAASIGAYFAEHALTAFDDMGADPTITDARTVLAWIERTGAQRFTKRDLFTAVRQSRFRKAADLDPALNLLTAHGYLIAEPAPERTGRGRPPSPAWLVHPDTSRTPAEVRPITAGRVA
jgi:hypothetical protein